MDADWARAIHAGDAEAVARLLDVGADVDARDRYGQTGLMIAAHRGHAAVVSLLVSHGADLDQTAKFTLSALMLAVVAGHTEIVRTLVAAGADRTIRGTGASGFAGRTALELAEAAGREACREALLAAPPGSSERT